jgi:mannose-6-phosphate isomerase class I
MSYNVFAMPSFTPTDSWNFFEYPMSNVVKPFDKEDHDIERKTVLRKMVEANQDLSVQVYPTSPDATSMAQLLMKL